MAFTHALSTNNYGNAKLIVATSAANGTHTTLAGAMADAVSGDTIFLRDSVTENVTLTAGVNIAAWTGASLNTPAITGTLTMTTAGTCNISGIELITNSAAILSVTGSAASIVNLTNCYLNCTNTTGITFSVTNAASAINILKCNGDIGTTGISLFTMTSTGSMGISYTYITNSGSATTASTNSVGSLVCLHCNFNFALTTTSTAGILLDYCNILLGTNTTALTVGGSGTSRASMCNFASGSASAISVGTGATLVCTSNRVNSTNTNAVTGVGIVKYTCFMFSDTSSTMNTSTLTPLVLSPISFGGSTLSTYVTGTWTPAIAFVGGVVGITYGTQSGYYTQIGNVVYINGRIILTSKGSSTGAASVTGLPVTAGANAQTSICVSESGVFTLSATYTNIALHTAGATNTLSIFASSNTAGGAIIQVTDAMMANTSQFAFCGFYIVA